MNQEERNEIIKKEMDTLIPANLTEDERGVWRMCFNALRLADFASSHPSGGEIIAMFATIQTLFAGHCTSMSGPVLDAEKKIIVLTCSNPNTDTGALLEKRKDLFPSWTFIVNAHSVPGQEGIYEKIDFVKH
jgi:hypothetical protein